MKTIHKVSLGLLFCAFFLGAAAYGVSLQIVTKPVSTNAAMISGGILNAPGLTGIKVWEMSAGPGGSSSTAYNFPASSVLLRQKVSQVGPSHFDFVIGGTQEYYDVFVSDANGNYDVNGNYITVNAFTGAHNSGNAVGDNIDAIELDFSNGTKAYASTSSNVVPGYNGNAASVSAAYGAPNASGLSGVTFLGDQFSGATYGGFDLPGNGGGNNCVPNGSLTQKCVGNSVYNFNSCDTQTTLVVNCSGSCLNGACVNNNNNNCVPNGSLTQKCVGNSVYNFNSCDTQTTLVVNCANSCVNGACVNTNTNNTLSVTTNPASNIVNNSATLNGYLNNLGGDPSVSVWFQWGTTTAYSNGNTTASTITTAGPFSFTVTSLTPNTQYHFRTCAQNGAGTVCGSDQSFTSAQTASIGQVQTLSANTITTTSANLNGQLSSLGGAASGQVFFQWGTTVAYGNTTTNQTQNVSGPFSQMIYTLAPGTTYHFRAGLTTSAGTVYGDDQTFTTNQNNNGGGGGSVACYSNNDCGGGGSYNNLICQGNSVYRNSSYGNTCINAGTTSSYCSNNTNNNLQFVYSCALNQYCSAGSCINTNNNNNYDNLAVNVQVRNLSTGNLNWTNNVSASPSDIVQFNITVQANSSNYSNNIMVRDVLPGNLYYNNSLMVDGISSSGNIISGITLPNTSYNQVHTITYQAQVAPSQNFSFNASQVLSDAVTATSANGGYGTGSASVTVIRSGVLGATDVSTGPLTGNFLVDSFFLPLVLALAGVWAWKSGMLNNLAIAGWVSKKKNQLTDSLSQKALENRIAEIKAREKK